VKNLIKELSEDPEETDDLEEASGSYEGEGIQFTDKEARAFRLGVDLGRLSGQKKLRRVDFEINSDNFAFVSFKAKKKVGAHILMYLRGWWKVTYHFDTESFESK